MDDQKKLQLFISYSHLDEKYIEEFIKHIAPLKSNGFVEYWYDRKNYGGDQFQEKIDGKIEDSDIICLFISSNFLSSPACLKEKEIALKLKKERNIRVVPIILSSCGWLDDHHLSSLLALPTDGKPISNFENRDDGWLDVYKGVKDLVLKEIRLRQLKPNKKFKKFLDDVELLSKAHSQKTVIVLDDIFIYPDLDQYDEVEEKKQRINSEEVISRLYKFPKVIIAGENQSGKTTLAKIIFRTLRKDNFIPVYINDRRNYFHGKIQNKIKTALKNQYEDIDISELENEKIIPILDDFHFANAKDKILKELSQYPKCVIFVDDIFKLNITRDSIISTFDYFEIKELKPSLRYDLIKKWICLTDKRSNLPQDENSFYKNLDKNIELIDSTLGKVIGKGIMPSYPFFILSTIVTYEAFATPLNQEITSQGYCYQALIFSYLINRGVKNDEIDTYINFLTELAYFIFKENVLELSPYEFDAFFKQYLKKFNLPISREKLLSNLEQIIAIDSFYNYSFRYPYLYYFFVAKYLAEHLDNETIQDKLAHVVNNLHIDENAYVAVFVAHHSKDIKILDEIELNAMCLFDRYEPATLNKDEVKFFDKQADIIIKAVLPPARKSAERARKEKYQLQDELELEEIGTDDESQDFSGVDKELRRAIKTVEVMGSIIKNRAGSLERERLEELFREAMYLNLRVLSYFFELIKGEKDQQDIINFISTRLNEIIKHKPKRPSKEKIEKIAQMIFWNLNFLVVYGIIDKIVRSLGSDKLYEIIKKVCDEIGTPSSFLVKHGILMWYNKNVNINDMAKHIKKEDFSRIAQKVLKLMIVNHCTFHSISYKDRQRIESKLGIPAKRLLKT